MGSRRRIRRRAEPITRTRDSWPTRGRNECRVRAPAHRRRTPPGAGDLGSRVDPAKAYATCHGGTACRARQGWTPTTTPSGDGVHAEIEDGRLPAPNCSSDICRRPTSSRSSTNITAASRQLARPVGRPTAAPCDRMRRRRCQGRGHRIPRRNGYDAVDAGPLAAGRKFQTGSGRPTEAVRADGRSGRYAGRRSAHRPRWRRWLFAAPRQVDRSGRSIVRASRCVGLVDGSG